jgi:hypothetical protein
MQYKVSELEGAYLDAAVALAEGLRVLPGRIEWPEEGAMRLLPASFRPSEDWSDGGPIIERERIEVSPASSWSKEAYRWSAQAYLPEPHVNAHGPTPLIAAMRCYVFSKFGDEIELP